MGENRI